MAKQKNEKKITNKSDRIMDICIKRASFYRANPHRFAEDYLNVHLKLFQKILIYAMMIYDYFYFVACRGRHLNASLLRNELNNIVWKIGES